jgi:hypothetical protein
MIVRVSIQFKPPSKYDWLAMRRLANSLTADQDSVHVFVAPAKPDWLVVEFTMPTEAQYKALPKIERAIKLYASNRWDSMFSFPYSEVEAARAKRKAERRKARRRARDCQEVPQS